jgi:DME family drug/metabolite transporter
MNAGVIMVAIGAALAGTLGTFGLVLNDAGFTGFQVASIRMLITSLTLLAFYPLFFRGTFQLMRANWKLLLPHSLAGVFGFNMFFFIATEYLGITLAVALLYTAPIWVMILAKLFLGEQSDWLRWGLAFCAVLGVAFILNAQGSDINLSIFGLIFGFGSAVGYAIFAVLGKAALGRLSATQLLFSAFTIGVPVLLLFPQTWQALTQLFQTSEFKVWGSFFAVGWFGTILINLFYMRGLKRISASTATVITTVEPLVATMLAVFFVGEILSFTQYLGVALIILSATMIGLREGK